ncbi:MAG: Mov34/MPN/PAD-1 family protein, partial [Candidatus Eremiobacteraeota bacterium]|nr:Mov34/MPN/PAD-1 family protein [Candidatus Eremiobacteraeota bacterium]
PEECVGLLIGEGDEVFNFIPLSNVHPAPRQGFALAEAEVALHLGKGVVGLYHSHPGGGGGEPSVLDDLAGFCFYWIVDPLNGKIYETRRRMNKCGRGESCPE